MLLGVATIHVLPRAQRRKIMRRDEADEQNTSSPRKTLARCGDSARRVVEEVYKDHLMLRTLCYRHDYRCFGPSETKRVLSTVVLPGSRPAVPTRALDPTPRHQSLCRTQNPLSDDSRTRPSPERRPFKRPFLFSTHSHVASRGSGGGATVAKPTRSDAGTVLHTLAMSPVPMLGCLWDSEAPARRDILVSASSTRMCVSVI